MKFIKTAIEDVVIIEPKVWGDERGYFFESYRHDLFCKNIAQIEWVQDNESYSSYGTLRGLHYQLSSFSQSKLVRVTQGVVLDVAVDVRRKSPTFGKHVGVELSSENKRQLFVPKGFAHGFVVLSETATFQYKVDAYYAKDYERAIIFDDKTLGIEWGLPRADVLLSGKDMMAPSFEDAEVFE